MAVSADFAARLTAAVAHAPASAGLTTVKSDISTLASDIAALVPQSPNIAIQIDAEDRLIRLATAVADELRLLN
jgi:hypothetical protein